MTEIEYVEYIRKSARDYLDSTCIGGSEVAITNSPQCKTWTNCREHLAASTVLNMCMLWDSRSGHMQYVNSVDRAAREYISCCIEHPNAEVKSTFARAWQECRMQIDPTILIMMCTRWLTVNVR